MAKRDSGKGKSGSGRRSRILVGLVVLLLCVTTAGFIYQTLAMRQDREKYPPPGQLVDVGGYRLHLYCQGSGEPTVILEAGLGDNWLSWNRVQGEIASVTRVCAYDRAGLGWSDAAPGALDRSQVADSLHTLLGNAGIPEPYILVGHSAGGLYVRSFVAQYPAEVAGMVLVDTYHDNQVFRLPPEVVQSSKDGYEQTVQTLGLAHTAAPFGLMRLSGLAASFAAADPVYPTLPAADKGILVAIYNRTVFSQALKIEYEKEVLDVDQERQLQDFGELPLTVLTKPGDEPEGQPPGLTEEIISQANAIQLELQQELAGLSAKGQLIIVEDTGHYIQLDQPEVVIKAIETMVESLQ